MLSSRILPSIVYNGLPDIDDQPIQTGQALSAIGALFVKYKVHDSFGLALLHKHFEMQPGEIMVHNELVCSPLPLEAAAATTGRSFFLQDGGFQAYEYEQDQVCETDPTMPNEGFLNELRSHLLEAGLGRTLALTRVNHDLPLLMEACGPDRTHVCAPVVDEDCLHVEDSRDTSWRFEEDRGSSIKIVVASKCKVKPNGIHTKH
ncbi:hypothetical protein K461DRAFT_322717 [Myriangium duriaei CBS 260.36]|uniref:Uncharacterized protein n=1 Tax=Myriangium duriaei CBS 260.36 TaxID=1168546 RepID=A0A9P4IX08_9PEZI|nr:hypothetical protein K461DRAFT_322717 [Myriangium duriaei CBS 260.36]